MGSEFRADRPWRGLTLEPVDTQVISEDVLRVKTQTTLTMAWRCAGLS